MWCIRCYGMCVKSMWIVYWMTGFSGRESGKAILMQFKKWNKNWKFVVTSNQKETERKYFRVFLRFDIIMLYVIQWSSANRGSIAMWYSNAMWYHFGDIYGNNAAWKSNENATMFIMSIFDRIYSICLFFNSVNNFGVFCFCSFSLNHRWSSIYRWKILIFIYLMRVATIVWLYRFSYI